MAKEVEQPYDGGPAFPVPASFFTEGMSLRDWFAAQAMAGMLAFPGAVNDSRSKSATTCARAAYNYADAMMAERAR